MANINARVIVDVSAEFKVDVISHPSCFRAIRQSQASIVLRHSQRRGPRSNVRSHTLYAIVRGRGRTRNADVAVRSHRQSHCPKPCHFNISDARPMPGPTSSVQSHRSHARVERQSYTSRPTLAHTPTPQDTTGRPASCVRVIRQ